MSTDEFPENRRTDDPPAYDASDPETVRRARVKAKSREEQIADFWARCLADPVGRMALWDWLILDCGLLAPRYGSSPAGVPDGAATKYHEGQRDLGFRMWRFLAGVDREGVLLMHSENDSTTQAAPKKGRKRN